MDHLMNSFFATILENSSPTLVTDTNGHILYVNRPALCLLERCRPFKKSNSNIVNDDPEPCSFIDSHYTSIIEPLDAYEATSLRNHFMNNVKILSKRTHVCRTIKCKTFSSRRPVMLEFSTRTCMLPEFSNTNNNSIREKNSTIRPLPPKNDDVCSRNSFTIPSNTISSIYGKESIEIQGSENWDEDGGENDDNEQFFDAKEYPEDDNLENNNVEQQSDKGKNDTYRDIKKFFYNKTNLGAQFNFKTRITDGQLLTVLNSTSEPENAKNLILISTIRDVTDSKFQGFVLNEAHNRISITYDMLGIITEISRSCKSILGFEPDELLGNDGYSFIHPDDTTKVRTFHAKHASENYGTTLQRQAFRHRKIDGSYCLLEIWSQGLQPDGSWSYVGFDLTDASEHLIDNRNTIPDQDFIRRLLPKDVEGEPCDKTANNFVSFVCHELRSPLNGIIGFTSLILDTVLSEQQRDYAEAISSISSYMCNIINQSLDLCQTQSNGTTCSDIGPLRLREIVEFGFLTVTVLARTKGTELRLQDNLTPLQIVGQNGTINLENLSQVKNVENKWYGYEDTVRKILLNYLTNAIKHTGSGVVTVRLEVESDNLQDGKEGFMARCSVEDTGPGIPQKDLKRLFLPYSKLVSSFGEINSLNEGNIDGTRSPNHQQSQRSSGLGLSICKELADKMGGKVGVESVLSKGSTFWFTFPVYTSMPEDIDDDPDTGVSETNIGYEKLNKGKSIKDVFWTKPFSSSPNDSKYDVFENDREILSKSQTSTDYSINSRPSSSSTSCSRTNSTKTDASDGLNLGSRRKHKKPAKVLMVEDNEINQRVALKYLEKMGEKVTIAANGVEALEKMKNETFDILFVDLQMPFMDGYALTRRIREAEREACQCDSQDCELPHNASGSSTPPPTPPGSSSVPTNGHQSVIQLSSLITSETSFHINAQSSPYTSSISFISSSSSSSSNYSSSSSSSSSESSYHSQSPSPTTSGLSNSSKSHKLVPSPPTSPPTSHKRRKHVPIVACTANVLDEEKGRCRQHGMDGFLSKPYLMEEMKQCIEDLVGSDEELSSECEKRSVGSYDYNKYHYDHGYEKNMPIAPI